MSTSWSCWCAAYRTSMSRIGVRIRCTRAIIIWTTSSFNGSGVPSYHSPTKCDRVCCSSSRAHRVCPWTVSRSFTDRMVRKCLPLRNGARPTTFHARIPGKSLAFSLFWNACWIFFLLASIVWTCHPTRATCSSKINWSRPLREAKDLLELINNTGPVCDGVGNVADTVWLWQTVHQLYEEEQQQRRHTTSLRQQENQQHPHQHQHQRQQQQQQQGNRIATTWNTTATHSCTYLFVCFCIIITFASLVLFRMYF